MSDRVLIRDLSCYGYQGVYEEERRQGQIFLVDLDIYLDLGPAGKSDQLARTVDYKAVCLQVEKLVKESRGYLLEALAEEIAAFILQEHPVTGVRICLKKPYAPLEADVGFVGVEIQRGAVS